MTQVRLELDEYTLRVLDVVKGKFGLKNRADALKRFVNEYGNDYVEPIFNEEYLNELNSIVDNHKKIWF